MRTWTRTLTESSRTMSWLEAWTLPDSRWAALPGTRCEEEGWKTEPGVFLRLESSCIVTTRGCFLPDFGHAYCLNITKWFFAYFFTHITYIYYYYYQDDL